MAEHESEDRFILTMMFALLIGYGCIANEIGSHLLGAFIAGMSFCWMQPALMLWHSQVKRIANWLIRLFFGATVAFSTVSTASSSPFPSSITPSSSS